MSLKYIITLFHLLSFLPLHAQTKVEGSLIQENKTTIPFANILVLDKTDSSFIKGEIVRAGKFSFHVKEENFLIRISASGFVEKYIEVQGATNLGTIILAPKILDEIEVYAKQLPFEIEQGNVKINVENSIFASSSSITEILTKSPGITVNGNKITVVGRGDAIIYLDGKEMSAEALNAIPVSQFESIEIIKNPDASYDAKGKAVINIVLKELGLEGFQGTITANYTKAFYHLGYVDLNLNWRTGKWRINTAINSNIGKTGTVRSDQFDIKNNTIPYSAKTEFHEKVKLTNITNYLLGIKYQFKPKHSASIQYNGNYSVYDLDVRTSIDKTIQDTITKISTTDIGKSNWLTHVIGGNYTYKMDSLNSRLFMGATYSYVSRIYTDTIIENNSQNDNLTASNSLSKGFNLAKLLIFQTDYIKNYPNNAKLKIGLKSSISDANSSIILQTYTNDLIGNDIDNRFYYKEQIYAGYMNWSGDWKKGYYQLGLRVENTTATAQKNQDNLAYIDTTYWGVFPNANLTFSFKKWKMVEEFSSKISRPSYANVSPFIYYLSSFASVYGNPNLKPSFNYRFEHKFIHEKLGTTISTGVNHIRKPMAFLISQGVEEESTNVFQMVNLDQKNEAYFEISQGIDLPKIQGYAMLNLTFASFKDSQYDFGEMKLSPKLYVYSYNRIPIKNWFNFEIIGSYTSAFVDGRQKMKALGEIGFGLSKSFSKNKWFVQLTANDILQTARHQRTTILQGNIYQSQTTGDTRFFRFSITYKFGKLKVPDYQHNSINASEMRRVN